MVNSLSLEQTIEMLIFISQRIISNKDYLNEIDRTIGDGDHGDAMERGFSFVIKNLKRKQYKDLGEVFLEIGNDLLRSIGGCSGIIFGTFFRSGGKIFTEIHKFDSLKYSEFLNGALQAIKQRGKAKIGDKTMVDVLSPAAQAITKNKDIPLSESVKYVAIAAKRGMEKTKDYIANIGRAKSYGEKAIGFIDPGAFTTYLIFDSMNCFINSIN